MYYELWLVSKTKGLLILRNECMYVFFLFFSQFFVFENLTVCCVFLLILFLAVLVNSNTKMVHLSLCL
jgi:hypothetical protein